MREVHGYPICVKHKIPKKYQNKFYNCWTQGDLNKIKAMNKYMSKFIDPKVFPCIVLNGSRQLNNQMNKKRVSNAYLITITSKWSILVFNG